MNLKLVLIFIFSIFLGGCAQESEDAAGLLKVGHKTVTDAFSLSLPSSF